MNTTFNFDPKRSAHRHVVAGLVLALLLTGGIGGWAATTEISGALIAPGMVVVDSNVKKVQHQTGGIVGELRVRNGSIVKAGEVIVRLDDTLTRANLAIVSKSLNELTARKARLECERDGATEIVFSPGFLAQADDPEIAALVSAERRLFALRRTAREGQKQQLGQRIGQLNDEIGGVTAQQQAKAHEVELIRRELDGVKELWEKNLIPLTRLTALEREATRLEGERAQLIAAVAQARGKISETELQINQIDRDLASEVGRELREIEGKISELVERKVAAEDQLKRVDIRAPQDGFVHEMTVHTVGGVVGPGEAMMLIVPAADALTVEARIAPQDIDQIRVGQTAALRFSAFSQRTTPEIEGSVSRLSADVTTDSRTGTSFFTVRIAITPEEIAKLGDVRIVPGMPVETFVKTGDRTVASYLVKPLHDQVMRAFRER
jgi:HlyD family secretion protein